MSRLLIALSVVLIAFLAGFFIITEFLLPRMVGFGDEVAVPLVVGKTHQVAMKELEAVRLDPRVAFERDDPQIPAGVVIAQNPRSGAVVKWGRRVDLTVSRGTRLALVPAVVGHEERQARLDLGDSGLRTGDVLELHDDAVATGRVIAATPRAGTSVPEGSAVSLLVSAGPPGEGALIMPGLIGRSYDSVQRALAARGFVVERARYIGGGLGVERVTEQTPPAGAKILPGERIALAVGG